MLKHGGLKLYRDFVKAGEFELGFFFGSIICIIIASFFELFGVSLTIPILNSLAAGGDFLSNLKIPYLGPVIKFFIPSHTNISVLGFLIALMLGSIWIGNAFLFLSSLCLSMFTSDMVHSVRTKIFEKYIGFSKAFYDRIKVGELSAILINSTEDMRGICSGVRGSIVNLIMAIAFLVFLFVISWQLSLMALPLIAIIYYPSNLIIKKIRASAQKRVKGLTDLVAFVTDILTNIGLVRTYTSENKEIDAFTSKSEIVRLHTYNELKKEAVIPASSEIIASSGFIALAFAFTVFYIKTGDFSLGKFLVYFFVLRRFVLYLKPVNELKGYLGRLEPIMEKIMWVFDSTDKAYIKDGSIDLKKFEDKIEFNNITFGYSGNKTILKDISFELRKNQMVALVGPTGAGKTTITNLLCRFYDPESGLICIDGTDIKSFTLETLRGIIGVVSQDTMLLNDTIENNIIYGLRRRISRQELDDAAKKAQIYDFIMGLPERYETYIGDRGVKLSGGEKQRVSIARAILKNAKILILDEATSALDSYTERSIQEAISGLAEEKTVLAIAHRLSTIKNAGWIVVIENGVIVEQGMLEELLNKNGRFSYYWNLQKFY